MNDTIQRKHPIKRNALGIKSVDFAGISLRKGISEISAETNRFTPMPNKLKRNGSFDKMNDEIEKN